MLNSGRTHKIRSRTDAAQPRKQVGGKHKRQEKHTGNPPARLPPVHSRIRRDETVNCVFRNSKHAQKLSSLNFFLFIGTAHDRTPERVVANLSQPAHENKTILTPLRAVRNSIVTSVRSLERPAQNPKFARNLTRPTHFGICATQQLKRPSRISPLQPPSGMDDQMRSHHTALSLSYVKNLNYKIQYFYLARYKTACSRVAQDRASSVHAGPADARGAGLRLPLRSCREPRKVAKAGFPRSERDFAAADARSPETS